MGSTTSNEPGAIDLHTAMPLSALKVERTPEQQAAYEKFYVGENGHGVETPKKEMTSEEQTAFQESHAKMTGEIQSGTFLELPKIPLQITRDLMTIDFSDFEKVALRVGTVIAAERVPKKDKLLKLSVDFDEGSPRQVIAGIGKTFQPESLVGQQYVFVANLAPREVLKGLVSNGMILATGPDAEHLVLIRPEVGAPNGARFS
jgi:methionine--tRNA ligase beta chain